MRYDYFVVVHHGDRKNTRLIKTRNQLVAWAVYRAALREDRNVSATAKGFPGTCVWCDGAGDNSRDDDWAGIWPCGACDGSGRTTHQLESAFSDDDHDYWKETKHERHDYQDAPPEDREFSYF